MLRRNIARRIGKYCDLGNAKRRGRQDKRNGSILIRRIHAYISVPKADSANALFFKREKLHFGNVVKIHNAVPEQ